MKTNKNKTNKNKTKQNSDELHFNVLIRNIVQYRVSVAENRLLDHEVGFLAIDHKQTEGDACRKTLQDLLLQLVAAGHKGLDFAVGSNSSSNCQVKRKNQRG